MLCACWPVGINSYLKAARISMSKSIQVACECWERNSSLKAISFTNQVVFSLRPEKDAYGVRAILPRPEGRGLSRFLVKRRQKTIPRCAHIDSVVLNTAVVVKDLAYKRRIVALLATRYREQHLGECAVVGECAAQDA